MDPTASKVREDLERRHDELVRQVCDRIWEAHPARVARWPRDARRHCESDTAFHLSYLGEAITRSSPDLFTAYVTWAATMLATRRIPVEDLRTSLSVLREVVPPKLDEDGRSIALRTLDAGLEALDGAPDDLPSAIDPDAPLASLARSYLDALLRADRRDGIGRILEAVDRGVAIRDLYLHVFQPCQREIGRLWQTNRITVAEEHYCTAATQIAMAQLYPRIFDTEKHGRKLVSCCVPGELHEMGLRITTDLFELRGWNTIYLGANTPIPSLVSRVGRERPDVVAVSATITPHVDAVARMIEALRGDPDCVASRILVGGYPFNLDRELWRAIGADGSTSDGDAAVDLADRLAS